MNALPTEAQRQARAEYRLWLSDPFHASLQFKLVIPNRSVWSVRVGLHWRALGLLHGDTITWFWIGSHAEYDRRLRS